jgi:enterochelin esterase-like enzyme/quercetin dioxygenase-like cupin family protein
LRILLACIFTGFMLFNGFSQDIEYKLGPNSWVYEGIPKGNVTKHTWESSIYPNTVREYYVYVPAQYDPSIPAGLMVFQDGHTYVKEDGEFRVPIVFDNLIAQGKIPVTIGVFINPGHDKGAPPAENPFRVTNRSIEYDEVSGTYGRFLIDEIIPQLKRQYNISDDPKMRAICGLSSGGICAFSAAWFHPDHFHRVMSHIGSFTDIRGGHHYPSMIRKSDRKEIKVFLQDGSNDLDNEFGNWWLANLQMEKALKFKNYDFKFAPGTGGHDGKHGGAILPESLMWLWEDIIPVRVKSQVYPFPESTNDAVLIEGETTHFDRFEFNVKKVKKSSASISMFHPDKEQIIIIMEGTVEVSLPDETRTIGPNGVAVILPGDEGTLTCLSPEAVYYQMSYVAKRLSEPSSSTVSSFIIDSEDQEFRVHDRGGVKNYFRTSTAMCPYYEMHVTHLNPGIKSHEPHTHKAAEIIIMIEGETEMEIGNEIHKAKKGDIYYLASNVPHAIKNIGEDPCRYFAFQWD